MVPFRSNLFGNGLTSTIPPELGGLTRLETLYAHTPREPSLFI